MKRYKYALRHSRFHTEKMAKTVLIIVIIALLAKVVLVSNVMNHTFSMTVISLIGESLGKQEIPVYAYMNTIDVENSSGIVQGIINGMYPGNEYVNASTSKTVITSYEKYFDETVDEPETIGNSTQPESEPATKALTQSTESSTQLSTGNTASQSTTNFANVISNKVITGTVYDKVNLQNYNFLLSNFYTVTSITSLGADKLKAQEFLDKDMTMKQSSDKPQILIFHTHSQEAFTDSVEGNADTTIVGVGTYLTALLTEKYGFNVIHDTSVYDYVDGKLDRSKAYTYATTGIEKILKDNPSIEVVIDLHRDGVPEGTHLVTEINGKQTAKIMFFNGISYSNVNGEISYLYNPYRDENLAMSLQMQLLGNAYYPGYLRKIYINAYRYCLHERGKSMLIEAGAQTNTVGEVKNAMEPLADILSKMLGGETVY